jgi:hypothetical protein
MLLFQIGENMIVEITSRSFFVRIGKFERFYNRMGLPSH